MRRNFFAGLFILLPFALTLFIASFIINLLTAPFQDIVSSVLDYYDILDKPFLFLSGRQVLTIFSKIFVLLILFGLILLIGFLGKKVILMRTLKLSELIIQRIPMVNKVYKATKEVVKTFFNDQASNFSQVVLVNFPNSAGYSIGLVSGHNQDIIPSDKINVFIPAAPNPTIGFMLVFKTSEVIFIDMKVDDALKCIFSCGVMIPKFNIKSDK